jgi:hypothetical protein
MPVTKKEITLCVKYLTRQGIEANGFENSVVIELYEYGLSLELSEHEIKTRAEMEISRMKGINLDAIVHFLHKIPSNTVMGKAIELGLKSKKYNALIDTLKSQYEDNKKLMTELLGETLIKLIIKY